MSLVRQHKRKGRIVRAHKRKQYVTLGIRGVSAPDDYADTYYEKKRKQQSTFTSKDF